MLTKKSLVLKPDGIYLNAGRQNGRQKVRVRGFDSEASSYISKNLPVCDNLLTHVEEADINQRMSAKFSFMQMLPSGIR